MTQGYTESKLVKTYANYGLQTLQAEYPILIASFFPMLILLCLRYLQLPRWYFSPVRVMYTVTSFVSVIDVGGENGTPAMPGLKMEIRKIRK